MVMLIDDDEDDCAIFREAAMEVTDCTLHCVCNSVEALAVLKRALKLPDCIFLDINMPIMDGFDVLKKMKDDPKLSHIPVIMYSTTPNPGEAERSIELGARKFIRKTSDYRRLVSTLKDVKTDLFRSL